MKSFFKLRLKWLLRLLLCAALGLVCGHLSVQFWPLIKQTVSSQKPLYLTSNKTLKLAHTQAHVAQLTWLSLLPEKEQDIIAHYQMPAPQSLDDMTNKILRSIEASTDKRYQNALISTNTVNTFNNQMVSISGFIVPIDFYPDKSVKNIFLVPYYGACIHFPPPPPNQILFAQLEAGFSQLDMTQAYTLTGKVNVALFEDPMGTSAYTIEVVSIAAFLGQPDDFRNH